MRKYFNSDVSLRRKPEERQKKLNKLDKVRDKTPKSEQVKDITSLIEDNVRRDDLPEVLTKFNCSQQLIDKYFT